MPEGHTIDANECGCILESTGKDESNLEADVHLQQQRNAWAAQRDQNQKATLIVCRPNVTLRWLRRSCRKPLIDSSQRLMQHMVDWRIQHEPNLRQQRGDDELSPERTGHRRPVWSILVLGG